MSFQFDRLDELHEQPLEIGVVGHTNHGKTSTIRTLCADANFGEVEDESGTTTGVHLKRHGIGGKSTFLIYDTPGFENLDDLIFDLQQNLNLTNEPSVAQLVDHLIVQDTPESLLAYRTLKQIVKCDLLIYVIDVREPLSDNYKAELSCLQKSGSPLVVAFNFTRQKASDCSAWVEYLKNQGIHTYCQFDAHTRTRQDERNLFDKMRILLPNDSIQYEFLGCWNLYRDQAANDLIDDCLAEIVAMLNELANLNVIAKDVTKANQKEKKSESQKSLERQVVARKNKCIERIAKIYGFTLDDISNNTNSDATSEDWEQFNIFEASRLRLQAVASGAVMGATIDAFVGGASFGIGAISGAIIGFVAAAGYEFKNDQGTNTLTVRLSENVIYLLIGLGVSVTRTLRNRGRANPHQVQLSFDKNAFTPSKDFKKLLSQYRDRKKSLSEEMRIEILEAITKP
ncbi:DUF3482 domain-containing protein [Mariniblastus sp.]|nr:DUF3482 domain-containing protein [Mariniblastus sp.]